jgi:hypothetical protein
VSTGLPAVRGSGTFPGRDAPGSGPDAGPIACHG